MSKSIDRFKIDFYLFVKLKWQFVNEYDCVMRNIYMCVCVCVCVSVNAGGKSIITVSNNDILHHVDNINKTYAI